MFQEVPAENDSESNQRHRREGDSCPALLINDPEGDIHSKQGRNTDRDQTVMVLGSIEVRVNDVRRRAAG